MIDAVSTNCMRFIDDNNYILLMEFFYSLNSEEIFTCEHVVPENWCPKIYLGGLWESIMTNKIIHLETIKMNDKNIIIIS